MCLVSRLDTFKKLRDDDSLEGNGGIPNETWMWETHDEKFRADLVSEFVHLDSGYIKQISKTKAKFFEMEKT